MTKELSTALTALGVPVTDAEASRLDAYLDLLERWNRVHNLTAVKERNAMIERHIGESLALRPALRGNRIADVGSGAGLPGIPLAIVEPERQFTLIESRAKRAAFLRHVKTELALANVDVIEARVEDLRDAAPFDTVLARAVASLPEIARLAGHLLGARGVMLVPTKADFAAEAGDVGRDFRVRRLEPVGCDVLKGALVAIEKAACDHGS
jgi:16S rRNA (guanine527-N7)-methyltransferase